MNIFDINTITSELKSSIQHITMDLIYIYPISQRIKADTLIIRWHRWMDDVNIEAGTVC
jgi:hypothetical protein